MRDEEPEWNKSIWQFPIMLLPLFHKPTDRESIVLSPVDSVDGMTASFTRIPRRTLLQIATHVEKHLNMHVFCDVTNKPPVTIEWE